MPKIPGKGEALSLPRSGGGTTLSQAPDVSGDLALGSAISALGVSIGDLGVSIEKRQELLRSRDVNTFATQLGIEYDRRLDGLYEAVKNSKGNATAKRFDEYLEGMKGINNWANNILSGGKPDIDSLVTVAGGLRKDEADAIALNIQKYNAKSIDELQGHVAQQRLVGTVETSNEHLQYLLKRYDNGQATWNDVILSVNEYFTAQDLDRYDPNFRKTALKIAVDGMLRKDIRDGEEPRNEVVQGLKGTDYDEWLDLEDKQKLEDYASAVASKEKSDQRTAQSDEDRLMREQDNKLQHEHLLKIEKGEPIEVDEMHKYNDADKIIAMKKYYNNASQFTLTDGNYYNSIEKGLLNNSVQFQDGGLYAADGTLIQPEKDKLSISDYNQLLAKASQFQSYEPSFKQTMNLALNRIEARMKNTILSAQKGYIGLVEREMVLIQAEVLENIRRAKTPQEREDMLTPGSSTYIMDNIYEKHKITSLDLAQGFGAEIAPKKESIKDFLSRTGSKQFNAEGNGYDDLSAARHGLTPDSTGHYPSRAPDGLILKGKNHPTWGKTVEAEKQAGYKIFKIGTRYYSFTPDKTGALQMIRAINKEIPTMNIKLTEGNIENAIKELQNKRGIE